MRDLIAHELAENALAMSIMDIRKHMKEIAADKIAAALIREDLRLLRRTVFEIEGMVTS